MDLLLLDSSPGGMITGVTMAWTQSDFEFKGGENDMVGFIMLDIQGGDDLLWLANSMCFFFLFFFSTIHFISATRSGWDIDPFVIISCGKNVFKNAPQPDPDEKSGVCN